MIKLIIFDYDGLLVDSEKIAFIAEKKILKEYGNNLTKKIFNKYLGYSVRETLLEYIKNFNLKTSYEKLNQKREKIIDKLIETEIKLMPGAKNLLKYIKSINIPMVIASSGEIDYLKKGLRQLGIIDYFQNITSVGEVKRGKPHPDLFLKALSKNHIKANEAVVLEDSLSGVTSAKKAKIFCIAVPNKNMDIKKYKTADIVLRSLSELKNMLEKFHNIPK